MCQDPKKYRLQTTQGSWIHVRVNLNPYLNNFNKYLNSLFLKSIMYKTHKDDSHGNLIKFFGRLKDLPCIFHASTLWYMSISALSRHKSDQIPNF